MSNVEKTREQILAERQEKKKKKAALKNQSKDKGTVSGKESGEPVRSNLSKEKPFCKTPASKEVVGVQVGVCTKPGSDTIKETSKLNVSEHKEKQQEVTRGSAPEKSKDLLSNQENVFKSSDRIGKSENVRIKPEDGLPGPDDGVKKEVVAKTKAQLKAERRAKQEAERAKKLEQKTASVQEKVISPPKPVQPVKVVKAGPVAGVEVNHKVKLFAHLYDVASDVDVVDSPESVHPSIIQLKTQFSSRVVSGPNASCLALLNALKKVVMDYETPANQEFTRGLESEVSKSMAYLSNQRLVAISMMNAVKHLRFKINQSKGNELECKNSISEWIDTYIKEQLEMAAKAICLFVREKITSGDVILTYGWSSLIHQILISAHNEGIKFQVIVADGRPWLEGRELLKKLVSVGIQCTYVFVNGLSFVMPEVTKILLGAHALLANGYVMSRVGSSQIALLAKTYNVPVLVCCETNKFSERVQTDSFVYNELGNPDDLASNKGCISKELSKWKTIPHLTPLNLMYDVTPPDLVSAVVTEIAVLPCTSVPVILRIKPPDLAF